MKPTSYWQLFSRHINSPSKPRENCFSHAYARLLGSRIKVKSTLPHAPLPPALPLTPLPHRWWAVFSKSAVLMIRVYQKTLSPFFPPCCRHHPSCSNYAVMAFEKKGFFKGSLLTLRRLLSCNPFVKPKWEEGF